MQASDAALARWQPALIFAGYRPDVAAEIIDALRHARDFADAVSMRTDDSRLYRDACGVVSKIDQAMGG